MRPNKGFTLVEVIMAMFIMSALTVLVSGAIRSSVKNKQKLSNRIYVQSMLYDTLRIMKMDIERAFNYKDVFYQIERQAIQKMNAAKNNGANQQQQQQQQQQAGLQLPPPPPKLTHFLGEINSIHFTSLNHFRTNYNAQESNQMEVGYFVDSCISRATKKASKCLWRRHQTHIDDEVDEGGEKSVIAENVADFKLSYRGDDFQKDSEPEWVDRWRSDRKGRPDHRDKFPHQVRILLKLEDDSKSGGTTLKETIVVNIHFPNNDPFFDNQQTGNTGNNNAQPIGN